MAIQTERKMTAAEYFEWEERQELKHEFIDGNIIETTGGTSKHSRIKVNLTLALGGRIRHSDGIIYNSDMRVKINSTRYVYPDLSVVHGEASYEDENELALLNPIFVVEVTSPTSVTTDRVDKLGFYLDVPSIQAYLIVDQDRVRADLFTRSEKGWLVQAFNRLEDEIPLSALNCELPVAQVYLGIAIEEA